MGQQEETRSIAAHDSLTKIYNFTAFCESSRKYLLSAGAGRSMGVIYANIIDFKSVNELYGLPEGDRMLGAFADFLKHLPRTRVCGRIFSDNFLCLFERTPGVDLYDEALGFAGAVERFLVGQQPFHPRSKPQIVSGISALEGGGEGLSAAIDGANIAHKEAKKKYRTACAVFDEALKDEMARAIRLQADLQAALEREQFTFYLQPKVNLRTGRVAGAEALARWKKPDGTVAGPAEFVPLLERTGNVEQLDFMIYEQVCRYLCGRQAGDSIVVPVSVNVSRAHLKDTDFVQKVKQLLIRYGVHPSLMEFELTETMLAESMEEAAAVIRGLRALGCKVSIDDFGTGYSALNLLKELEFDILKLDGSFVSGAAAEGYKSDVILRNIIRMADELYMTVLCEGLETAGQVERLNTFGCTLAQGYYFAQPMPAEAFEAFVQQAGGYCALPWGGADGAQRLPDYCEASALTDSAVRSITHSLFDAVPCAVAGVDPSSRQLLFANEQLFSLCGYPRGQMAEMEKAFFAHIATEPEKARLYAEMRRQFGTAGRCDTKLPVRRADGSVIWVRMTATYAGSPEWGRYLLCFFYDITREQTGTAAKSREIKQLSEERDFYAGMLSSIPCAVAQFRAEADGTMPFIRIWPGHEYWDTKAWRTSGASRTRMSSRAFIRTTGAVRWVICPGCAARATRAASSAGWCAAMARCAGYPGHFRCCPARRGPLFKSCFWILPTDMRFKHGSCITTSAWRVCRGRSCLNMNTVRTCLPLPALQNRAWNCRSARRLSSPRSMPGAFPSRSHLMRPVSHRRWRRTAMMCAVRNAGLNCPAAGYGCAFHWWQCAAAAAQERVLWAVSWMSRLSTRIGHACCA